MEVVFEYRISVLHPLAAHFPPALLVAAAITAIVWMFRETAFWRQATCLLVLLGAGGSLFAYFTGQPMKDQAEGTPIVDELVGLHEQTALYAVILAVITACALGVHLALIRRRGSEHPLIRLVLALLVLSAAALVAFTAHVGATMVWGVAR